MAVNNYFILIVLLTSLFSTRMTMAAQVLPNQSFTLTAIYFNKTSLIDSFEFFPFYKDYLGRKIQLSIINDVCGNITKLYKISGFHSVRCLLSSQNINDGIIQVFVDEDVIGKVSIKGDVKKNDAFIKAYIEQIILGQPLDVGLLSSIKTQLNAIPGIRVTTDIRVIADTQTRELVFDVEATPFAGELYMHNRGSKAIGSVLGGLQIINNSLFGKHEQIILHLLTATDSEELKYAELKTTWPVGNGGSTIEVAGSYVLSQPGDFLQDLDIETDAVTGHLAWRKPFLLSSDTVLSLTGGFDYFKSNTSLSSVDLELNELYKFKLMLEYEITESNYYSKSSILLNRGLPGLNTVTNFSNPAVTKGRENFKSVKFNYYQSAGLSENFILSFQTQGQYAFTRLPASEYIAFGGETMGSAYDPAEFLGDHGLGGNVRLGYQLSSSWVSSGYTQLFTQYDAVKVWNDDFDFTASRSSLSVGLMLGMSDFHVDFQLAKPLTRDVYIEGNRDIRYFASARYFF